MGVRAEGFAAVPTWMIRDTRVSVHAIAVFASLASRAGFEEIHPSQATLAAEARCSERKVRDALNELEELGVIRRERRKSMQGRASNAYTLHPNGKAPKVPASGAVTSEVPAQKALVPAPGAAGSGTSEQTTPLYEVENLEVENLSEVAPRKRGTRIPDPFILTAEMKAWAAAEVPGLDIVAHTREFVDYWRAKSGKDATKVDWVATWRNWMRKAHRWQGERGSWKPAPDDRLREGLERGARLQALVGAEQRGIA